MNEVDRFVVAAFPDLQRLLDLGDGVWRFISVGPRDDVRTVLGIRTRSDTCSDELRAHVGKPAWAGRTVPGGLSWERSGTLAYVVRELLVVPAPDGPGAPCDILPHRQVPSPWAS